MSDEPSSDTDVEYSPYPVVPAPDDTPLGTVWPPIDLEQIPPGATKLWVVAWLPDHDWCYICIAAPVEPEQVEEEVPPQQPAAERPI